MSRKELIRKELIIKTDKVVSKTDLFKVISDLAFKAKRITNKDILFDDLLKRENEGSTAFENGLMMPHSRTSSVSETTLVIVEFKPQDFGSLDGEKTDFAVAIIVPQEAADEHLNILSSLSQLFSDKERLSDFRKLSVEEKVKKINALKADDHSVSSTIEAKDGIYDIVAITSCAAGIAHTYMARDALIAASKRMGYTCKVETRGAMVENRLSKYEIANAKVAIIAADTKVPHSIFAGKKFVDVSTNEAIRNAESVINKAFAAEQAPQASELKGKKLGALRIGGTKNKEKVFMKALMSAISFMIPIVVVGGILMAIPNAVAMSTSKDANGNVQWKMPNNFAASLWDFGKVALTLMVPILSMVLALKIGGKPAAPAGLVGGFFINDGGLMGKYSVIDLPEKLGTSASAGFLGGLVVGIFAGYLVRWMQWIKWHRYVKPISGLLLVPLISGFITYIFVVWVIGSPMTWLMAQIYSGLSKVEAQGVWLSMLIGMLFAGMIAIDLGGPINKTAYTVAVAIFTDTLAQGNPNFVPNAAINAAIGVPPLGMWLATVVFKKRFSQIERTAGAAALPMGLVGISEGAIPFAFKTPLRAIIANVSGAMLAGALVSLFKIRWYGGLGSPIGAWIGYSEHSAFGFLWVLSTCAGIALTGILYGLLRKKVPEFEAEFAALKKAKIEVHNKAGRTTKKEIYTYNIKTFAFNFVHNFKYAIQPQNWIKRPEDWNNSEEDDGL